MQKRPPVKGAVFAIFTGELHLVIAEVAVMERVRWLTPYLHITTIGCILVLLKSTFMEISPNISAETSLSHSCVSAR
jgi:hypothetical protein